MYAVFNVDDESPTIVGPVYFLHNFVTKPQISRTTAWGEMNRTAKGPENKKNFLDDFSSYVNFLKSKHLLSHFLYTALNLLINLKNKI